MTRRILPFQAAGHCLDGFCMSDLRPFQQESTFSLSGHACGHGAYILSFAHMDRGLASLPGAPSGEDVARGLREGITKHMAAMHKKKDRIVTRVLTHLATGRFQNICRSDFCERRGFPDTLRVTFHVRMKQKSRNEVDGLLFDAMREALQQQTEPRLEVYTMDLHDVAWHVVTCWDFLFGVLGGWPIILFNHNRAKVTFQAMICNPRP